MKTLKLLAPFMAVMLIFIVIYLQVNKKTVHEVIDESVSGQLAVTSSGQMLQDDEMPEVQPENQTSTTFKETVGFLFIRNFHVVAIGDSLTQGIGDETNNGGYIGILDDMINNQHQMISFENYGKQGNRTDQLLKRLDQPEISSAIEGADIVLMTIGANDIMQVVKENFIDLTYPLFVEEQIVYEKRLNEISQKLVTINPKAQIYLLGLYNPFKQYFNDIKELDLIMNSWNQTGEEIVQMYENITFIPIKDLFDETDVNLFAEDNFHPNLNGYQRIAKRVLTYLVEGTER